MLDTIRIAAIAATTALLPALPVAAQSLDLGVSRAFLSFEGLADTETQARADLSVDVRVTAYHGLQLDLGAIDSGDFWMGTVGAHLYMQPSDQAKYGFFLAYSDANDEEAATTEAGVEGIWQLSQDLSMGIRLGTGRADHTEIDYLFGEFDGAYALSKRTDLTAGLALVDIDEKGQDYSLQELELGVTVDLAHLPIELSAGIQHSRISGTMETEDTRLSLGLVLHLGPKPTAPKTVAARRFAPVRPLREVIAQGVVWPDIAARHDRK